MKKAFKLAAFKFLNRFAISSNGKFQRNSLGNIQNILFIELARIGDLIVTTPVLRSTRKQFPNAHIAILTQQSTSDILINNSNINEIIVIRSEKQVYSRFRGLMTIRRRRFQVAVSLSPGFWNSFMTQLCGARYKTGYLVDTSDKATFYNDHLIQTSGFSILQEIRYRKEEHLIERAYKAVYPLGVAGEDWRTELNPSKANFAEVDEVLREKGISKQDVLIVMHPMAGWFYKAWPERHFVKLANRILSCYDTTLILIGGSADKEKIDRMSRLIKGNITCLLGLPLLQSAALISYARLFIGNDSGPTHIARAVGAPIVALYGPTNPKTTGYQGENIAVIANTISCSPCTQTTCKRTPSCLEEISVDQVFDAVVSQMRKILSHSNNVI